MWKHQQNLPPKRTSLQLGKNSKPLPLRMEVRNSISREKSDQQARDKERRITLLLVIPPNLNVFMRIPIGSINVMNPKVWLKITRNHRSLSRQATSTHCNLSIFVNFFQSFISR